MTTTRTHPSVLHIHDRGQLCGIPVPQVRDEPASQEINPIPFAPPAVVGSLNLRGRIVTSVDLRVRFGLPPRGQLSCIWTLAPTSGTTPVEPRRPTRRQPITAIETGPGPWCVIRDRAWRGSWLPSQGGSRSIVKPQGSMPSDDGVLSVNWSQAFPIS